MSHRRCRVRDYRKRHARKVQQRRGLTHTLKNVLRELKRNGKDAGFVYCGPFDPNATVSLKGTTYFIGRRGAGRTLLARHLLLQE